MKNYNIQYTNHRQSAKAAIDNDQSSKQYSGNCNLRFVIIVLLSSYLLPLNVAYASFEDIGVSARPIGMGNAFTALADDANTIYYNPAGLGTIHYGEIVSNMGRLYLGLSDGSNLGTSFIGVIYPLSKDDTIGGAWVSLNLFDYYQENTFILSYGKEVLDEVMLGLNFKLFSKNFGQDIYTNDDPLFIEKGYSKTAFGVDLGILYRLQPFSIGVVCANLNSPDVGLKSSDVIPLIIKGGIAYKISHLTFAFDGVYQDKNYTLSLGAEKWFFSHHFGLRSGFSWGNRNKTDVSAGLSYRTTYFQFDYAFLYPLAGIVNIYGSHRVSLSIRFGDVPKDPEEISLIEMEKKYEKVNDQLAFARKEFLITKDELGRTKKLLESEQKKTTEIAEGIVSEIEKKIEKIIRTGPARITEEMIGKMERKIDKKIEKIEKVMKAVPVKKAKKVRTYEAKKGDTLQSIAGKFYGNPKSWTKIYNANKDKIKRGKVKPGTMLVIPE